MWRLGVIY